MMHSPRTRGHSPQRRGQHATTRPSGAVPSRPTRRPVATPPTSDQANHCARTSARAVAMATTHTPHKSDNTHFSPSPARMLLGARAGECACLTCLGAPTTPRRATPQRRHPQLLLAPQRPRCPNTTPRLPNTPSMPHNTIAHSQHPRIPASPNLQSRFILAATPTLIITTTPSLPPPPQTLHPPSPHKSDITHHANFTRAT